MSLVNNTSEVIIVIVLLINNTTITVFVSAITIIMPLLFSY